MPAEPANNTGKELIFIASQPRSGSTLTQVLLASHEEIVSPPEIWLMLLLSLPLQKDLQVRDFHMQLLRTAVSDFLATQQIEDDLYFHTIRQMATPLYRAAIEQANARYLIDKTPRYYAILPTLRAVFPESTIIVLLRNPCAVLCSVLDTWIPDNQWHNLIRFKDDLLRAPQLLTEYADHANFVFRYEDIVTDKNILTAVYEHLGIAGTPHMDEANVHTTGMGDPKIRTYSNIQQQNADAWQESLRNPQIWRLAKDYLHLLGADLVTKMGYDFEELDRMIDQHRPAWLWQRSTLPLTWIIERTRYSYRRHPRVFVYRIMDRIRRLLRQ